MREYHRDNTVNDTTKTVVLVAWGQNVGSGLCLRYTYNSSCQCAMCTLCEVAHTCHTIESCHPSRPHVYTRRIHQRQRQHYHATDHTHPQHNQGGSAPQEGDVLAVLSSVAGDVNDVRSTSAYSWCVAACIGTPMLFAASRKSPDQDSQLSTRVDTFGVQPCVGCCFVSLGYITGLDIPCVYPMAALWVLQLHSSPITQLVSHFSRCVVALAAIATPSTDDFKVRFSTNQILKGRPRKCGYTFCHTLHYSAPAKVPCYQRAMPTYLSTS